MAYNNNVTLIGNLTKDVELRQTNSGKDVATFSVAVSEGYGDKKKTNFIGVRVWGQPAKYLAQYAHKGDTVAVSGSLEVDAYKGQDGSNRTATYVLADSYNGVQIVHKKADKANSNTVDSKPAMTVDEDDLADIAADIDDSF